jgi:hypothetical protein
MEGRKESKFMFWVGSIKYSGKIISENETHWIIWDVKEGRIEIPKTAVRKEVSDGYN